MSNLSTDQWNYEAIPNSAQHLYRMTWQLESWMRTITYVELRAANTQWEDSIKKHFNKWPPYSQESDKELYHMATPHQLALSYISFAELWKIIIDKDTWPLFEPYFPPRDNTLARIEEIKTIRNRVGHFREPHRHDESRMTLFMQDMNPGIRRFCSRYTTGKVSEKDPVVELLEESWPHAGYGTEMLCLENKWLYAPKPHTTAPLFHGCLQLMSHKKYNRGSFEGLIYMLTISPPAARDRQFNVSEFLEATRPLHKNIIHILVKPGDQVSITIPAISGINNTVELICTLLQIGLNCSRSFPLKSLDSIRSEWPEYVLWPNNILSFYSDDISEPILDLD